MKSDKSARDKGAATNAADLRARVDIQNPENGAQLARITETVSGKQFLPRQIVTLAFLSDRLFPSLISRQLALALSAESGEPAILVRFTSLQANGTADGTTLPDAYLNGEFHLPATLRPAEDGLQSLTLGVGPEPPSSPGIASLFGQLSLIFRYILVEVAVGDRPAPWILECLRRSDLAFLFVQAAPDNVYRLDLVARELQSSGCQDISHVKPVACLAEGEQIDGFDMLALRVGCPIHIYVRNCPGLAAVPSTAANPACSFRADIRRIARQISGRMVGLALSSGAAKGFAHIGVIQVFEENGIEIDVVAGASMGAYVGALWTYGHDGCALEKFARELEGRWSLWSLVDPAFPPRQGFLRGFAVKNRLMRSIGSARFGDLARPLRVVAANLATLERMTFCSGGVATAVHASVAVPGICVPVTIDGETYVDGGIVDPLPVDVLREMGAARIIAVDAIPTPDRIRYGLQAERELAKNSETKAGKLFRKVLPLNSQLNYFARGNVFEILMRSVHGAQIRMAEAACRRADIVLRPDICNDRWMDFRAPAKFISPGREVAARHLDEIKDLLADGKKTYELAPNSVASIA